MSGNLRRDYEESEAYGGEEGGVELVHARAMMIGQPVEMGEGTVRAMSHN